MIQFIILSLVSFNIVSSQATDSTIPIKKVLLYTPDIVNYSITDQIFDNDNKKFDRIVAKDHFVNHQLRKDHPQRERGKKAIFYQYGGGKESGAFYWALREAKVIAENNTVILVVVVAFLVFMYWRGRGRARTSVRLPQIEEEIHSAIPRRQEQQQE